MEHRWHPRTPACVDVTLHHHDQPVTMCRTRDISRDGMFIEVDPDSEKLEPGRFIRATLRWRDAQGPRRLELGGLVVHRAHDGVGVLIAHRTPASVAATTALVTRGGGAAGLVPQEAVGAGD